MRTTRRALRTAIAQVGNDNAQREYYLTDTVELLIAAGRRVVPVPVADYRSVLGVNDRVELASANAILNRRLCEVHMRAGVTIADPATTYLVPGLQIAADVTIRPNTVIYGATRIGEGTSIGPNCRIGDATIGARCDVRESVVTSSEIAAGVTIGPFAHLRGGSRLADGVRIGNFVELKNADLADGVKSEPPRVPGRHIGRPALEHRRGHHHRELRRRAQEPHRGRRRCEGGIEQRACRTGEPR